MKKLLFLGLTVSLSGLTFAQAIYNSQDGLASTFTSGSTPRCSFADDMVVPPFPNGAASVTLGKQLVRYTVQNAAQTYTARVRFYDSIDMAATGTNVATANVIASYTWTQSTALATGTWITTVDLAALNISLPSGNLAWSLEFFTDNTLATYNVNVTPSFNRNPIPVGSGVDAYYRDGSVASTVLDGIFTGGERRIFTGSAGQMVTQIRPRSTVAISGTVVLQDFFPPNTTDRLVTATLKDVVGTVMWAGPIELATAGTYSFEVPDTVPDGTYTLTIGGPTWLNKKSADLNIVAGSPITGVDFSLVNGNAANTDQVIDLSDYTAVAQAFNALLDEDPVATGNQSSANWNLLADVNLDGVVDLTDYTVVATNFNAIGD